MHRVISLILCGLLAVGVGVTAISYDPEAVGQTAPVAAPRPWSSTTATWYGPGLYGNGTYCGQRYTQRIRGVAIGHDRYGRYYARCGQWFTIRRGGKTVRVQVIDRCPGCVGTGHLFDLSARTAMDLCRCWRPYTMQVRYRRGR